MTPKAAPSSVKPAHGKSGKSDPVPKDRYDATMSGTRVTQSTPSTSGVATTSTAAAAPQAMAKRRGVRVRPMSTCSASSVMATFCSTSTAKNERQRSSVAYGRSTKRPIGNFTK